MRLIVAGSRSITDYNIVEHVIDTAFSAWGWKPTGVEVISGCAEGVDKLGERWARVHGFFVTQFPAAWHLYGKRAGFLRNERMVKYAAEDEGALVAVWDGKSRGTKSMIDLGRRYLRRVHVAEITMAVPK